MNEIVKGEDWSDCIAIIDFDTPVFKAAKSLQEDYIVVTRKDPVDEDEKAWSKEFKNITTFHGRGKKKNGGWIQLQNSEATEEDQINVDMFVITTETKIVSPDNYGFSDIKKKVESIMEAFGFEDFILCIGGDENYRYDLALIQPYKGQRKAKPLKLPEMKQWTIETYKERVNIADGEEADDVLAQFAHEDFLHHRKTGKHKYVLLYIDKDIDMTIAPHANYDKLDLGISVPTPYDAARCFCKQMLTGDKTDNIMGLPNLSEATRKKYGIRKSSGIGPAAIEALFCDATKIKDLFHVVAECYSGFYGDDPFLAVDFRDPTNIRTITWVDALHEHANLLWMRRERGVMYDTRAAFERFGVKLPKEV